MITMKSNIAAAVGSEELNAIFFELRFAHQYIINITAFAKGINRRMFDEKQVVSSRWILDTGYWFFIG